jgi:hypothetical protein
MESGGIPDAVQVTRRVYEELSSSSRAVRSKSKAREASRRGFCGFKGLLFKRIRDKRRRLRPGRLRVQRNF